MFQQLQIKPRFKPHFQKSAATNGFTLIEILVVMVIIGILAALSIGGFQSSQLKARDAKRKSDLKQITNALEFYRSDRGQYPESDGGQIVGCGDIDNPVACTWGEPWLDENGTLYMSELPADPRSNLAFAYVSDAEGSYYQVFARLENTLDYSIAKLEVDGAEVPGNYGVQCGSGAMCNYGLASPNSSLPNVVAE